MAHTGGRTKGDGKGKTGGRKPGTPNKVTGEAKEIIVEIVNGNLEKVQDKLDLIVDPDVWLRHFEKLCEFVVPKKAAVQVSDETKSSDLRSELEEMTDKEI